MSRVRRGPPGPRLVDRALAALAVCAAAAALGGCESHDYDPDHRPYKSYTYSEQEAQVERDARECSAPLTGRRGR